MRYVLILLLFVEVGGRLTDGFSSPLCSKRFEIFQGSCSIKEWRF